ncbi:MAG: hypothetical protein MUE70_00575 [Desulfobacterales bacterium]|nr:hypothetical protein [Desulfobacterales bacterium]
MKKFAKNFHQQRLLFFCLSLVLLLTAACEKPKEGKVVVSEQEFAIRQDAPNSWVIDAKGKVKNVGGADVKNVEVTGYCRSCGEVFTMGSWYVSEYDKTPEQKDVIRYLPAGAQEDFSFTGVAFMPDQSGKGPDQLPDNLECEIVSFETVDK